MALARNSGLSYPRMKNKWWVQHGKSAGSAGPAKAFWAGNEFFWHQPRLFEIVVKLYRFPDEAIF
jgi:hypothetical protein